MDLGFNLAQNNRDLKDPTSRQNFGDTSGLLCKNDLIPCPKGQCNLSLDNKYHVAYFLASNFGFPVSNRLSL